MKLLSIACFVFVFSFSARSQWTSNTGTNTPVCTTASFKFGGLNVVSDSAGGEFLIWIDMRGGQKRNISGQHLSEQGYQRWQADGVPIMDTSKLPLPVWLFNNLIPNGTRGSFVTNIYSDNRLSADVMTVQRLDSNGAKMWNGNGFTITRRTTVTHTTGPEACRDGRDGIIFAIDDTTVLNVLRLDGAGSPRWGNSGVVIEGHAPGRVNIVPDQKRGAIVFYCKTSGMNMTCQAQRVDSSGNIKWQAGGVPVILNATGNIYLQRAISCEDGGAIVLFSASAASGKGFYLQKVDSAGNVKWGNSAIMLGVDSMMYDAPSIVTDGAGGTICGFQAYTHTSGGAGDLDVYALRIDTQGNYPWGQIPMLACWSPGDQMNVRAIEDGAGGAVLAWDDGRDPKTLSHDVYAQRISASGQTAWKDCGVVVSDNGKNQTNPQIVADGFCGAIITWWDARDYGYSIYAARIDSGGTLLPVDLTLFTAKKSGDFIKLNWRTENETNNYGFYVERAIGENGPWRQIAFVAGSGNTTEARDYAWSDPLTAELCAFPFLYYRLRQSDYDGAIRQTGAVEVAHDPLRKDMFFDVYPNPASNGAIISFASNAGEYETIKLYDVFGRCVATIFEGFTEAGVHAVRFDPSRLSPGMYPCVLTTKASVRSRIMIVVK